MADCLTKVFNSQYIDEAMEKQSPDTDQGCDKNKSV